MTKIEELIERVATAHVQVTLAERVERTARASVEEAKGNLHRAQHVLDQELTTAIDAHLQVRGVERGSFRG
jgi:outer membrane protein TolC